MEELEVTSAVINAIDKGVMVSSTFKNRRRLASGSASSLTTIGQAVSTA